MDKYDTQVIVIDDDIKVEEDPLIFEIEEFFDSVTIFNDAEEGLDFIKKFLHKKMIVLLDLSFPSDSIDGHKILELIRKLTSLVPVIIWSGVDENKETFSDLINNSAFAFMKKDDSSENILAMLHEANHMLSNDVASALEEWISIHSEEDKNMPYMLSVDGEEMTLNDILKEVRIQSVIGKSLSNKITKLTIDLLNRNKENLNGKYVAH